MRWLTKTVLLLATATVLAASRDEAAAPLAAGTRGPQAEGAHGGWNPETPTPGFVPQNASWGGVFNASSR